jgi:hypothetical protein
MTVVTPCENGVDYMLEDMARGMVMLYHCLPHMGLHPDYMTQKCRRENVLHTLNMLNVIEMYVITSIVSSVLLFFLCPLNIQPFYYVKRDQNFTQIFPPFYPPYFKTLKLSI